MKKISSLLLLALVFVLAISACVPVPTPSNDFIMTQVVATLTAAASLQSTATATPQPAETQLPPTAEPTNEVTVIGPDNFPEDVNPLTGEKVEDPALLNRRPVLIKVSNFPASGRPHAGLSSADIVFAYAMPGLMSRYIGLYYGKDANQVGPVRSARLVDPEIVQLYQGVLGASGGDEYNVLPKLYDMLGNRYVFQGLCPGICDDGHGWVTTVFGDSAAITQFRVANGEVPQRFDLTGMLFDKVAPAGGTDTPKLSFNFSSLDQSDWTYDAATGKYLRWIDNAPNYEEMIPLVDRLTEKQLAFSNVLILETVYSWYDENLFNTDILDNMPGLKAVYLRDGKQYEGTWKVTDPFKPIQFFDNQGNLFPLKPGNTWINFTGTNTEYLSDNNVPIINFLDPGY